jgi:hypothetical protein
MLVAPLPPRPAASSTDDDAVVRAQPLADAADDPPSALATTPAAAAPVRDSGGRALAAPAGVPVPVRRGDPGRWNPQLQRQLSDAQQAQDFLDRTAAQLQSLKADLSGKLAGLQVEDSQLQAKLAALRSTWASRSSATGGSMDAQLVQSGQGQAVQRFSVRGLDLRALQAAGPETLTIATAANGRGVATVSIDPNASADTIVQRFDQALAPLGIRVASDDSGALIFSAPEAAWPALRDHLAIKGDGIRFPTGQLNRVRTDPEPAALQPNDWQTGDAAALRRTLQQVVQALDRIRQARAVVSRQLTEAERQVEAALPRAAPAADPAGLAMAVGTSLAQPGYTGMSTLTAAVAGISRSRVLALLSLPPGV